ncbi:hypothetical protein SAMN05421819_1916 [Bryocella elongata]|uniref:DoxX protein n=1 Tax=Bryocella elongata TaxID=863522 RepID=A0A1H5XQ03_9BACT|nr:DoxX family protein [Bryocella elongata]SEG13733.1 hypothetical protein SAMN05421819_1916 [Bryocella elongata]
MKIVILICRVLLGLMFVVFGLNGLHPFIPMKGAPAMPPDAMTWSGIMMTTGWMKVLSGVQILGGALVLSGFFLPLGIVLLCAETFNILCFHLFLTGGQMIAPGIVTGVLELAVIFGYRDMFRGMFQARASLSI